LEIKLFAVSNNGDGFREVPKSNTLDTIKAGTPAMVAAFGYNGFPRGEPVMVKHGALSKSHMHPCSAQMTRMFAMPPSLS
jgi:hypothetical protein